jgi:hypothetical protein
MLVQLSLLSVYPQACGRRQRQDVARYGDYLVIRDIPKRVNFVARRSTTHV